MKLVKKLNLGSRQTSLGICRHRRETKARRAGSTIMLAGFGMVVMLGFASLAVDYGISVNTKNKLQRTCDAAALAASARLVVDSTDQTAASNAAIEYAAANGVTITSADVTFPRSTRVHVKASQQRDFLFAGILGFRSGTVSAAALAGRSFVHGMLGALPLGITQASYYHYKASAANPSPAVANYVLTRNTQEKFGPLNTDTIVGNTTHNIIALDLRADTSGNSGALFQNEVVSGSPVVTRMQTYIDPLGSSVTSQGNKIARAIDDRLAAAAQAPYNDPVVNRFGGSYYDYPNYGRNNPRVVWILVGADGYEPNHSNPKLELKFFAQAYIVGPVTNTTGSNPEAVLPLRIMSSGEIGNNRPDIIVGDDAATDFDTGAFVNRLLG